MHLRSTLIAAAALGVVGCSTATQQQAAGPVMPSTGFTPLLSPSNPFSTASTLQYQAPPFDRIKDSDYEPAMEAGMVQQIAEIDAIANQAAAPTFDNTIVAMERSGVLLTRAAKVFNAITAANTNDTLQAIQERLAPKLAEHSDKIYLNDKLFRRVKANDVLGGRPSWHRQRLADLVIDAV
jgi:peptidyl-dipeptidase Dcp